MTVTFGVNATDIAAGTPIPTNVTINDGKLIYNLTTPNGGQQSVSWSKFLNTGAHPISVVFTYPGGGTCTKNDTLTVT